MAFENVHVVARDENLGDCYSERGEEFRPRLDEYSLSDGGAFLNGDNLLRARFQPELAHSQSDRPRTYEDDFKTAFFCIGNLGAD